MSTQRPPGPRVLSAVPSLCARCGADESGPEHCSFCGGCLRDVGILVAGQRGRICPACVVVVVNQVSLAAAKASGARNLTAVAKPASAVPSAPRVVPG